MSTPNTNGTNHQPLLYRYYVSFAFQSTEGPGIGAADYDLHRPISSVEQIPPIRRDLESKGYQYVMVLGFSRYADPSPDNGGGW